MQYVLNAYSAPCGTTAGQQHARERPSDLATCLLKYVDTRGRRSLVPEGRLNLRLWPASVYRPLPATVS